MRTLKNDEICITLTLNNRRRSKPERSRMINFSAQIAAARISSDHFLSHEPYLGDFSKDGQLLVITSLFYKSPPVGYKSPGIHLAIQAGGEIFKSGMTFVFRVLRKSVV
jgi:hypothetical protein